MVPPNQGSAASPAGFLRRVLRAAHHDDLLFLASALSFDALIAAIPFALLVLAAVGQLIQSSDAVLTDAVNLVGRVIPSRQGAGDPRGEAERVLLGLAEARGSLSIVGIPFFLLFATRFFSSVRIALNEVFDTLERRHWLRGLVTDAGLVGLSIVFVVINFLLSFKVFGPSFLGGVLTNLAMFVLGIGFFVLVYRLTPARPLRWDTALVAGLVASLLFVMAKWLYTIYLVEFATLDQVISNENVLALLLLFVWVYYTACVFLIGAEVADTYDAGR